MVLVKEAAQNALAFARDLLGDTRTNALLLEEVELSDDEKDWLVTVSVPAVRMSSSALSALSASGLTEPRDYKLIRIDAGNGSPRSIKIRKL